MQSEEHIKRLVRELDLPEQADQVVLRSKYWTPAFCWRFFERCDDLIFDDAHSGLQAAEVAPELVDLVCKFSRDREPRTPLKLRALCILGSAHRATGQLDQAERVYQTALALIEKEPVAEEELANLLFRIGCLRIMQQRSPEALDLADQAIASYRRASAETKRRYLGEVLTVRGTIHEMAGHSAAAVRDLSEALSCTDPRAYPRIHHVASHNLACILVCRTVDSRSLSRVESYLRQARKFLSKRPRSVQKLRVIWLQGIIMIRFGSTRRGEAALNTARKGLVEMKAPFDMAMVSVDLGRYFFQSRQFSKLQALAIETQQLFKEQCSDQQANEALVSWGEEILTKTLTVNVFEAAWLAVQRRAEATTGGHY